MNTLELTLQRKTDSGYPVIAALTRPGGFLPLRREGTLSFDPVALSELQYDPLAYGAALGQALFVDEIRDTFVKALGDEPLRVLLSVEAPDLRALDWHRLAAPFDGRWRCLASQQNTPFSLSIPSPASAHFPALGRRDLRALLLVAGPESLSGDYKLALFDIPATIESIQAAFGNIPCDVLENPSLDTLCATLTATPYTILHLVCHGAVNERGETILYFAKDERRGPTPAADLLDRLASLSRLPHFVFLSACESALPQNGLGSLAGRLVRELGLPAVLAMTDRVSIATAGAIAAPFYAHLYQHGQPDLALAQSLAGLQGAHDLTVPAIFSRLGDRPLFDNNSERALTDKELEFGLAKLAESLPERAPVMDSLRDALTRRLRSTLGADIQSLSESRRTERRETLDQLNSLSLEALDLSFNALCLGQIPPTYDSRSPFRGLESFRPEDAPYFFGREALTRKLVQKLNEHNFLAVLGASGSGKSSLVMAGLIPALNIPYAIFRPGAEPLSELEKALQAGPQLLVVDQFEELFTLSAREQRVDFISRLLEHSHRLRVVITLRADFLGEVAPFKSLKDEVENHQVIIPPLDEAELRRAMEGQAGCAGLRFESDLSQQMLDDVAGEPGAMPLLQHALWTLWTRRHGRWLRAEEYRAFGGVKQAIASTAEAVFAYCTDFEKERLRDIFLRLTRLDESADGRDTRRRILLRDLIPADSDPSATTLLVKQLADARLVVVTSDEVEVAHEALIRHWERLRAWLNDDRDNLRLREGVSDDARRWENAHRDESLLNHRGPRLELALAMSKNPRYRLNPVEQAYLDGCVGMMEREKAAAAKQRRYIFAFGVTALAAILITLAGWGLTSNENSRQLGYQVATAAYAQGLAQQQASTAEAAKSIALAEANIRATAQANAVTEKQNAIDQAKIAHAGELATQAELLLDRNFQNSLLLGIESFHLLDNTQTRGALLDTFYANPRLLQFLMGSTGSVTSLAFSPDGKALASASLDNMIILWDVATGQPLGQPLKGHLNSVSSTAFSPDGKTLASGSWDNTIILWDVATGQPLGQPLKGHLNSVYSIAFSPDGKTLASGSADTTIILWDVATGQPLGQPLKGHTSSVTSIAFSPDGKTLASGSLDNTIILWDVATGQPISQPLKGHVNSIESVVFSPDGRTFASGSGDRTIILWDVKTGQPIGQPLKGHAGAVESVVFSPDGKTLASGSRDKNIILWDVATGQPIGQPLKGHASVESVAFSPDGTTLASGSLDNMISLWDVKTDQPIDQLLKRRTSTVFSIYYNPDPKTITGWDVATGHQPISQSLTENPGPVSSVAFSPDGKTLVSGSADTTIVLWDVKTGQPIGQPLKGHTGSVTSIAFGPNGRTLASGSGDKTIILWDVKTGQPIGQPLKGHTGSVTSVAFSPDGRILASGSADNTIILWDVATGQPIGQPLKGHTSYVESVAFSPDGKTLASGSADNTIILWDVAIGRPIGQPLKGHTSYVESVAFSPDGKTLASGSLDNMIILWDVATGQPIGQPLNGHIRSVSSIAFSPDGKTLASGSDDNTIILWDVATGQPIGQPLKGHTFFVSSIAFSPDGKTLASGSLDTTIILWSIDPKSWIKKSCQRAGRNFTRAEWAQYGFTEPYRATCPQWPLEPEPTAIP